MKFFRSGHAGLKKEPKQTITTWLIKYWSFLKHTTSVGLKRIETMIKINSESRRKEEKEIKNSQVITEMMTSNRI